MVLYVRAGYLKLFEPLLQELYSFGVLTLKISFDGVEPGLKLLRESPLEPFPLMGADLRLKLAPPRKLDIRIE
jgi:hypothetical protein